MFMAALFATGKEWRASCIHLYMNTEHGMKTERGMGTQWTTISTKTKGNPAMGYNKDER